MAFGAPAQLGPGILGGIVGIPHSAIGAASEIGQPIFRCYWSLPPLRYLVAR
jgi:hypothetical protein